MDYERRSALLGPSSSPGLSLAPSSSSPAWGQRGRTGTNSAVAKLCSRPDVEPDRAEIGRHAESEHEVGAEPTSCALFAAACLLLLEDFEKELPTLHPFPVKFLFFVRAPSLVWPVCITCSRCQVANSLFVCIILLLHSNQSSLARIFTKRKEKFTLARLKPLVDARSS